MLYSDRAWPTKGPWAVLLLFACSPLLWYSNKIHTELFTFVCVAFAAAAIYRRQFLWAGLALAIATTQNLPWGAVVIGLLLYWFISKRSDPITYGDSLLIATIVCICLIHPIYYILRYGALTPQLLQGSATLAKKTTVTEFFAPLFDLDIGLLPNWPLGILLIIAWIILGNHPRLTVIFAINAFLSFAAILFLLFSQSRSENINSGATINVSRYGLWYIGLLLPGVATVISSAATKRNIKTTAVFIPLASVLATVNIYLYRPLFSNPQSYTKPTYISNFVQNHLPYLYNPPQEVFRERFGKLDEDFTLSETWAISTPSGSKMLILPDFYGQYKYSNILGLESHVIPPAILNAYIAAHKTVPREGGFVTFTNAELAELDSRPTVSDEKMTIIGPKDDQLFGEGWWQGTSENRIAKARSAEIVFNAINAFSASFDLDLTGYAPVGGSWVSALRLNGKIVATVHDARFVRVKVGFRGPIVRGLNVLSFESVTITSPAQSGENSDNRLLGSIFYQLQIRPDPTK